MTLQASLFHIYFHMSPKIKDSLGRGNFKRANQISSLPVKQVGSSATLPIGAKGGTWSCHHVASRNTLHLMHPNSCQSYLKVEKMAQKQFFPLLFKTWNVVQFWQNDWRFCIHGDVFALTLKTPACGSFLPQLPPLSPYRWLLTINQSVPLCPIYLFAVSWGCWGSAGRRFVLIDR